MSEIGDGIEAIDRGRIEKAVREIIEALGEDPEREGLSDTPERVANFYAEVFDGLHREPGDVVDAFFGDEHYQEIVMVREIPFYSMCEHHFVPFHGQAHVAYIPKGRITGLSKLARLVDGYARRPKNCYVGAGRSLTGRSVTCHSPAAESSFVPIALCARLTIASANCAPSAGENIADVTRPTLSPPNVNSVPTGGVSRHSIATPTSC